MDEKLLMFLWLVIFATNEFFFSEVDHPILVNGTCQSILEKFKICLLGQGFDRVLRTSLTATK